MSTTAAPGVTPAGAVFGALAGQDAVVAELAAAASGGPGAVTHAWLFTGPPGVRPVGGGPLLRRGGALRRPWLRALPVVPPGGRGKPR